MESLKEKNFEIMNLIQKEGYDYEETTSERNGYPANLEWVITAESISELLEIKEKLINLGYDVAEYCLHKKSGWSLWHREGNYIELGKFLTANQDDYSIDIDMDDEEKTKAKVLELLYGEDKQERRERAIEQLEKQEDEDFDDIEDAEELLNDIYSNWNEEVKFFIDQLPKSGKHTVFYNPNSDFGIDYIVNAESTFYESDGNQYKLAIGIN